MARRTAEERRRAAAEYAASRNSSGSSGYNAATSAGRSSTSAGYGQYNRTARDEYWGDPAYAVSTRRTTPSGSVLNSGYYQGTNEGYQQYRAARSSGAGLGGLPSLSGGGGGGGGGYGRGGGGGGGGGPALTQAMLDQMLKVLGVGPTALTMQQVDLPAFVGQNLPAFNPAVYNQATQQLNQAAAADTSNINAATQRAQQALQANYTNAYANAPVAAAPAAQQVGGTLQQTAGGGGNAANIASESNSAAASDQASFANLLNVLAAADQTAQASRMNQTTLDQNTALQALGAQQRGLLGGINMARTQAYNQWAQADAERRYQNSLMAQQWQREEMMRNQDVANQTTQANWQARNQYQQGAIQPLLDLIGQGRGLNYAGVQALLNQWGAGARA